MPPTSLKKASAATADGADGIDYRARVRELAPLMAASGAAIDQNREIPTELVDGLVDAGLFRLLLPRSLNGAELLPTQYVPIIEDIAKLNGSVAWCVNQNSGCSMTAAYLSPEAAREIFGGPRGILAWGPGPRRGAHRARRLPRHRDLGFRQREPPFVVARLSRPGRRRRRQAGPRQSRQPGRQDDAVPEEQHQIHRHLAHARPARHRQRPMVGQGSLRARGAHAACAVARRRLGQPRGRAPLPVQQPPPLRGRVRRRRDGLARSILDSFIELARDKIPRGARVTMRDNNMTQFQVAHAQAKLDLRPAPT